MKRLLLILFCFIALKTNAQVTLGTSPFQENFNGIGSSLPNGFTVRTSATATSLGTAVALTTAATAWNNTTGAFKNFASATAGPSSTTTTVQAAAADRALGLRQTGSYGDPGGAFVFQLANTLGKTGLKLSFDLQSLDISSTRTVTWTIDYAVGASPTSFTTASATGTLITGNATFTNNTVNVDFGTALDNKSEPVWIRIVALSASTGSSNRPTSAIDNFNLTFVSNAAATPTISVTPNNLAFGNQNINTNSTALTYTLSGSNLTDQISINATAPFSLSKDNTSFTTSLNYSIAEVASSPLVYVRYSPTAGGNNNSQIAHTSTGASPVNLAVTGAGIAGNINTSKSSLDFSTQVIGTSSTAQSYTLTATGLSSDVTVSTNAPFEVSKDNTSFSGSLTYTAVEVAASPLVYVRFSPTSVNTFNENVLHVSSFSNSATVALTGSGINAPVAPQHVVISEVYGGGGNSGAVYKNDFIELYNPSDAAVDLTGWSVQYASATGTTWQVTPLTGSIPAKSFYLIQQAAGSGGTTNLPTPDAIGTIALSGTTGKVILSNSITALTGANPAGAVVIDKVGFGPTATGFETTVAAVLSNTTALERKASAASTVATMGVGGLEEFNGNGYDTDNNSTDFIVTTPNPQNSLVKEPIGANHVVIAEVYGGGGNSGAVYKNDFIELYNPTSTAVNLTGWSVQYASATGTSWQVTTLSGSIAPKSFYLVQQAAGTGGTTNLPTPDKIGTIAMAAGAGKVLLANVTTAQTGSLPTGNAIIDLVGYGTTANGYEGSGAAPVPSATFSVERKASAGSDATTLGIGGTEEFAGNGYDTDDNALDLVAKVANPQNSTFTEPASLTGPYLTTTPKTLSFGNQAINTSSTAKTYVLSGGNLTNNTTITANAPFSISKDNVTFGTNLSYTVAELATAQTVYVRFAPTATGNATSTIVHSSAGATNANLTLTGAAIDPTQTAFNFENCTIVGSSALADGFYQYSVAGPQTWGCTTTFGHDNNDATGTGSTGNALQINGYASGNILNEDWLISPALNLSNMTYAVLSFWTRSAFAGDKLQLKISTNYSGTGDPNLATWISIDGKFPESGSDVWTKSNNIDLSAYKALPVYVAFVYNSTTSSASRWTVDDFAVTNSLIPPPVDVTVSNSSLNFGFQAAGTTSTEKTFSFSAGNLTGDVTLTAPANFSIAKTSGGTFTNTITYDKTTINNTSPVVYAKFSPSVANTNYTGNVTISTAGSSNKTVSLAGNTFDIANTLEVVNWNIEWFGSPAQDPANDVQQAANVKTIVNNIGADIYGFAEVVDTTLFRNTVLPAGYNVIFSEFGSYADNKLDPDYPLAQKLAFMYRTDLVKPIRTFGVLQDTYNPAVAATSADGTPYKNWSSGRFPFALEANVTINGKTELVYFIEIHAKANTGTTADQIDSYNRRKAGNQQLKNWIDANLTGKKVIILGDFNDVLNPDKTIAPMPAGTGTSYSDFTNDMANYFPITLPLSLAGKQSTAGFNTVIDNVIINKNLNINYIEGTAEVLDAVKNLVTNYSSTTTDHYPIRTRYLFGNGEPTLAAVNNQTLCYTSVNQTIALTGISAGPETTQITTLAVTSDNPNLFDVLTVQPVGADKGTLTYRLKNNVSGIANITVTVTDNGGTAFGGINTTSKTFRVTVNALPNIVLTKSNSDATISKGTTITLTANGAASYTWAPQTDIIGGQGTATLTVRPKQTTTYTVTGTSSFGCTSTQQITVVVTDDYQLKPINILTPNGDGKNDKFTIENIDYYPNNTLKVFDRSGRIVYTKQGYNNEWDGSFNGSPLASDTYYYIVEFGTNISPIKGYITLIRN